MLYLYCNIKSSFAQKRPVIISNKTVIGNHFVANYELHINIFCLYKITSELNHVITFHPWFNNRLLLCALIANNIGINWIAINSKRSSVILSIFFILIILWTSPFFESLIQNDNTRGVQYIMKVASL